MSNCKRHTGYLYRVLFLCVLAAMILASLPAYAQQSKAAVTRADLADADYALQGEFIGTVLTEPSKTRPLALQIRSNGDGSFEGVQHIGGFPGERARRGEPVRLSGNRTDGFVVLSGGPWVILVHADHGVLVDPEGKRVGRLERIHRQSPSMGAQPPKNAIVLFDGTNTDQFTKAEMTDEGLLMQGADFKPMFQDFNLHLEFLLPYMPVGRGQGRANSGVYLQSRYELQILDSFAIDPGNNGCASLYKFRPPEVNVCFPPLVWQTYDIIFTAPRWAADESKIGNARITAWHNGVKVHDDVELPDKTGAGKPEAPTLLPIRLQDHGNPVRFRNIWVIDRGASPATRFPIFQKLRGAAKDPRSD